METETERENKVSLFELIYWVWTQTTVHTSGSASPKLSDVDRNHSLALLYSQLVIRDLEIFQLPWKVRCKISYSSSISAVFIANIFLSKDEIMWTRVWLPRYKDTRKEKKNLQFLCNTITICQEFILFQCLSFWGHFSKSSNPPSIIFSVFFLNRCVCRINCPEFSKYPLLEVTFLLKFGIHENWAVEYAPSF